MTRTILALASPAWRPLLEDAAHALGARLTFTERDELDLPELRLSPGVVVVDLLLPGGVDAVELVRRSRGPSVPIVALAAWLDHRDEARLVAARVATVLFRPVAAAQLEDVLETLLPPRRPTAWRPSKVLVVDDDEVALRVTRMRLSAAGFEVVTARSGELGVAAAQAQGPDAVVCDVWMPHVDGFAFTQRIRRDPELGNVPVILLDQQAADTRARQLGFDCGADAYIEWSTSLEELVDTLNELLARDRSLAEVPPPDAFDTRIQEAKEQQIDRLIRMNVRSARMRALSDSALSILGATASAVARRDSLRDIQGKVLQICVDSGALALAVLYLRGPGGTLQVEGAAGDVFVRTQHLPSPHAVDTVLTQAGPGVEIVALPGSIVDLSPVRSFLAETNTGSALVVPLRIGGQDLGALVLGSDLTDISSHDWRTFARTLSTQLALALSLLGAVRPPPP